MIDGERWRMLMVAVGNGKAIKADAVRELMDEVRDSRVDRWQLARLMASPAEQRTAEAEDRASDARRRLAARTSERNAAIKRAERAEAHLELLLRDEREYPFASALDRWRALSGEEQHGVICDCACPEAQDALTLLAASPYHVIVAAVTRQKEIISEETPT